MDYVIINQVIKEIISLINYYNRDGKFSLDVCEKLVVVLLGYYLTFGTDIFKKINEIMEQLQIHIFNSSNEYKDCFSKYVGEDYCLGMTECNPVTFWDYKYDNKGMFRGAIPHIFMISIDDVNDALTISHELSHSIDGLAASVIEENEEFLIYRISFTQVKVIKKNNISRILDRGFAELITVNIENRILDSWLKLDVSQIESSIVKDFLVKLKSYRGKNVIARSYCLMSSLFKDLFDNDDFFSLIKKFYYDNDEDNFELGFNSLADGLSFDKIKRCANHLMDCDINDVIYYGKVLNEQLKILNGKNKEEGIKKLLFIV